MTDEENVILSVSKGMDAKSRAMWLEIGRGLSRPPRSWRPALSLVPRSVLHPLQNSSDSSIECAPTNFIREPVSSK